MMEWEVLHYTGSITEYHSPQLLYTTFLALTYVFSKILIYFTVIVSEVYLFQDLKKVILSLKRRKLKLKY